VPPFAALLLKCERLQIAGKQKGASLESCCSASSAHGTARTEAQRLGMLACLATSKFKRILGMGGYLQSAFPSPAPKMRTSADRWQPEGGSLESCCSASSAHGTARTEAQRLGLLACLAASNFKCMLVMRRYLTSAFPSADMKMRKSADSWQPEGASLRSCYSASSALGTSRTEAQRLGMLACLATSDFKCSLVKGAYLPSAFRSADMKMRTSADSWQPEGASLESCCSASSAHGTARTEAQRMGLLAYLATSNFKRSFKGPSRMPTAALLPKCECLWIAGSQKGQVWKAFTQLHMPLALLAQRHRDCGCFLVLKSQTSNVKKGVSAGRLRQPCSENANVWK